MFLYFWKATSSSTQNNQESNQIEPSKNKKTDIYINKTDAQQKIRKFILKWITNFQKRNRCSLLFGRTTFLQAISASEKQHFHPRKITMNAIHENITEELLYQIVQIYSIKVKFIWVTWKKLSKTKICSLLLIAHFQKEWKTGARVGARWILGSFRGRTRICSQTRAPPNDPITERTPTLAPVFHSFWKWAMCDDQTSSNPRHAACFTLGMQFSGRRFCFWKQDCYQRNKTSHSNTKELL